VYIHTMHTIDLVQVPTSLTQLRQLPFALDLRIDKNLDWVSSRETKLCNTGQRYSFFTCPSGALPFGRRRGSTNKGCPFQTRVAHTMMVSELAQELGRCHWASFPHVVSCCLVCLLLFRIYSWYSTCLGSPSYMSTVVATTTMLITGRHRTVARVRVCQEIDLIMVIPENQVTTCELQHQVKHGELNAIPTLHNSPMSISCPE
jgi:hypothetical protein